LFAVPEHDYTRALIRAAELPPKRDTAAGLAPTLMEVTGLTKQFALKTPGLFGKRLGTVQALNDVSFAIGRGETFAIVGESGCGKSTLARTLLGLHAPDEGAIRLEGATLAPTAEKRAPAFRRRLQMIFQDPYASLNPRLTAAESVAEPLVIHGLGGRRERTAEAARAVGLEPADLAKFPHAFSGGERQRIAIARALVADPELIVADEPLSSLDVSIQAQIIELLSRLKDERRLTYIFISHDLAVVEHLADRVAVMYLGRILESGPAESLFKRPSHPYTRMLLEASPHKLGAKDTREPGPRGEPASPVNPPAGCPFHPRCPKAQEICRVERPVLAPHATTESHHLAACHFPESL
jgi:oligopeptide/dipeptide ABC transporter ATP-binding protein